MPVGEHLILHHQLQVYHRAQLLDSQDVLQLPCKVCHHPCLVDECVIKRLFQVHQEHEGVPRDAKTGDGEGESVEAGDVKLLVSLLSADVPYHVAKDQDE